MRAERASSGVDETEAVMKPRDRACDMSSSRAVQGEAHTFRGASPVWHTGLSGLRILAALLLGHEAHAVRVEEVGG
eukprot:scaffold74437_cov60-Phaeocystis_antarctica.AAC.1